MSENDAPRDEWGELKGQLDEEYPRSWRPGKKVDRNGKKIPAPDVDALEIMGTVIRVDRQAVTFQGKTRMVPAVIVATHPEGELRSVWCLHTTLQQDVERQAVQEGDKVAIRYNGLVDAKDGENKYHSYRLAVRRPALNVPATAPDFGDEPPY